jgi:hypothetical protein
VPTTEEEREEWGEEGVGGAGGPLDGMLLCTAAVAIKTGSLL